MDDEDAGDIEECGMPAQGIEGEARRDGDGAGRTGRGNYAGQRTGRGIYEPGRTGRGDAGSHERVGLAPEPAEEELSVAEKVRREQVDVEAHTRGYN